MLQFADYYQVSDYTWMSQISAITPENGFVIFVNKIKHFDRGRQKVISKQRSSLAVISNLSTNNKHALVSNYRQGVKNSKENTNYNFK